MGGRGTEEGAVVTLGSLFDGIGGWLLAACHAGVTPVWASEIEPFPCSVTARHCPNVKQLGDITQINLDEIEPVDIVCAGSPCQDLSIAGKRKGLCGERSGLFRTAVDLVRDGLPLDWCNARELKSHGGYWTHNIGECPNVAVESSLSRILQPMTDVPEKYYLSAKACLGILRRAQERGKELPEELRIALERQARNTPERQDSVQEVLPEL